MRLWLATGNAGKLEDFAAMGSQWEVGLLPGFTALPTVAETGATCAANARIKAEHYSRFTPDFVVADDSGLEVEALGGAPGVHSARFAGRHGDDSANNRMLLEKLRGVPRGRRRAAFVCVLAVARMGETLRIFEGRCE
ncbi:MAG: non-canonical purine NTP pyrophosphatase, partial [Terriglobales bacterium]